MEFKGQEVPQFLVDHVLRYSQNLSRVNGMIDLHQAFEEMVQRAVADGNVLKDDAPNPDDVLRLAVVLLHSAFEDTLRSMTSRHFKLDDPDLLEKKKIRISVKGESIERLTLGGLASLGEKTAAELVRESVDAWLSTKSFSNLADVTSVLQCMGLNVESLRPLIEPLVPMMQRRHRIVHNADRRADATPSAKNSASAISKSDVATWKAAVEKFINQLLYEVQHLPPPKGSGVSATE